VDLEKLLRSLYCQRGPLGVPHDGLDVLVPDPRVVRVGSVGGNLCVWAGDLDLADDVVWSPLGR